MAKHIVQVYSTDTCSYCVKAKNWLIEKGVKFEDYNIAEDDKRRKEMVEVSGQMGVPVIVIDDETVIIGFDPDALIEALELE